MAGHSDVARTGWRESKKIMIDEQGLRFECLFRLMAWSADKGKWRKSEKIPGIVD